VLISTICSEDTWSNEGTDLHVFTLEAGRRRFIILISRSLYLPGKATYWIRKCMGL